MTLEDRIIEFLDGGLTSAERSALLREVHRSPRAKELLEHHRQLRSMAKSAARAVHAPARFAAELAAIAAVAPTVSVPAKSRRTRRLVPLTLLLLASGVATALLLERTPQSTTTVASSKIVAANSMHEAPALAGSANTIGTQIHTVSKLSINARSASDVTLGSTQPALPIEVLAAMSHNGGLDVESASIPSAQVSEIASDLSFHSPHAVTIEDLRGKSTPKSGSRFVASLQTSSGFTSPADAQPVKPFAGQRLGLGYYVTTSDVIGVRLTSGLYQTPGDLVATSEGGVTFVQQGLITRRAWGGEVYASHRIGPIFNTPVVAVFTAAGGLIPNGYTVGAEAGLRIPASEKFSFAVDFSLSRVHSSVASSAALASGMSVGSVPVMLSATNVRTTLNGSLHYGIEYNF